MRQRISMHIVWGAASFAFAAASTCPATTSDASEASSATPSDEQFPWHTSEMEVVQLDLDGHAFAVHGFLSEEEVYTVLPLASH